MSRNLARTGIRRVMALGTASAFVFAGTFAAIPASAETDSQPDTSTVSSLASPAPAPVSGPAPAAAPAPAGVSDDGLNEAILRDLRMTPEQFAAAGEQGKRTADDAASLRGLPGYVGISLKDGKIVVEGTGAELQAKVAELNRLGPDEIVLVAPDAASPSAPSPAAAAAPAPEPAPASTSGADPGGQALIAASTDQLYQAYVREVGPEGLQAVAFTDGHFVIRTGGTNAVQSSPISPAASSAQRVAVSVQPKLSPSDFVAKYANVKLEKGEPIAPQEDFFGGQGYYVDGMWVCSAGYSAFSPSGEPLVLTAGHCADDGAAKLARVAIPAGDPAGGSTVPAGTSGLLGSFGFSQFGGPNNSRITGDPANPGNVGTDIAVIQNIRSGLDPQPSVAKWDNPSDLGADAVKIVGQTLPFQGQAVCRSGRTDGWSCGTVDEVGIYVMGGPSGQPDDLRAIRGFLSYSVQSSGGDSGGPWISGNYAVGTHTAGDAAGSAQNFAVATTLEDALTRLPGVQLELFLNKPVLTGPADAGQVAAGQTVTGRVDAAPATAIAANSKVRISVPCHDPIEVPVGADGTWQFAAPAAVGKLSFTAETVNGFSSSGAASFEVNVAPGGVLPAPEISAPAEGAVLSSVTQVEGTGTPGATVQLTGGITGTATVSTDCRWTAPANGDLPFGTVTVSATQTAKGMQDGSAATRTFTHVPPPPTVTNVQNGQHFAWNGAPQELSGTGLEGAQVSVTLDGTKSGETVVEANGAWRLSLPAGVEPGNHTLAVKQSVDGVDSADTVLTFVVDPEPKTPDVFPAGARAAAGPAPGNGGNTTGGPAPGNGGNPAPTAGQLASTGASEPQLFAAVGGGLLALGGVVLVAVRRKRRN